MSLITRFLTLTALIVILGGCSTFDNVLGGEEEKPLAGERVSILELQNNLEPDSAVLDAQGFIAPMPWRNEFWPQAGGYPNHVMQHLALGAEPLREFWQADIGRGSEEGLPLTAQPVVVDGKIFTLDSQSLLSAFSIRDGRKLWNVNVSPQGEEEPVISGGLAYSHGRLFVTSGFDEVLALSPEDGSLIWRARIPAPSRAAPTVVEERLFVVTLDNRLLALSTETGEILWEFSGLEESAHLVGAPSPAASQDIVIPAFSSGEIFAIRVENGSAAWGENLSAFRAISGLGGLSDIQGLPVIDKGLVIAVSFGGRMMAIDERTGRRIWQRDIGSAETPWVAGNHVFVITTENELVALGRDNGAIRWVTNLPRYRDEDSREDPVFWSGPVFAGGRLILAGTNGTAIAVDPATGRILRSWSTGKSIIAAPVVAGEVLYLLAEDGTLLAYK